MQAFSKTQRRSWGRALEPVQHLAVPRLKMQVFERETSRNTRRPDSNRDAESETKFCSQKHSIFRQGEDGEQALTEDMHCMR